MTTITRRAAGVTPLAAVAALAPLLVLAACTAPPLQKAPYVAPTAGPTARVLVRATVTGNDLFGLFVHDDALGCTGPRVATTGRASRAPTAVTVAAGQLQTIELLFVKPDTRQTCSVRSSLTPVAGKTYLYAGSLSATGCNVRVFDATQPDAMRLDATAVRRSVGAQRCIALADSKPLSPTATVDGARDEAVIAPNATADDLSGLIGR